MCTIPQIEGIQRGHSEVRSGERPLYQEPFRTGNMHAHLPDALCIVTADGREGVSALSWSMCGYRLLATSRKQLGEMMQFGFYKSCISSQPNLVSRFSFPFSFD
jgi:hypothetical protein